MPFLVIIALIAAIFFSWFFKYKSEQEERLILIEKDVPPEKLPPKSTLSFNFPWLKIGCLTTGIALGGLIGGITEMTLNDVLNSDGMFVGFGILLFGGLGMIIGHYLDKPNNEKPNHDG